jgi:hypothetical protein
MYHRFPGAGSHRRASISTSTSALSKPSRRRDALKVCWQRKRYLIDVFDNTIDNADAAYITTHACDTWEQVEKYCRDYDRLTII